MAMDISNRAKSLLLTVVASLVLLTLLASTAPQMFTAVADINGVFTDPDTTTNSTVIDSLLDIFPILIAIGFVLGIVGVATGAVRFGKR